VYGIVFLLIKVALDWNLYALQAWHKTGDLLSATRDPVLLSKWKYTHRQSNVYKLNSTTAVALGNTVNEARMGKASRFAYAMLIGGCDPAKPSYKGFLYNALVAATILREQGSTADFIVLIQMSFQSEYNELPEADNQALEMAGIRARYLAKSPKESFYNTVMSKFRILSWTEYDRVLFMDADVLPMANLDYVMHQSVSGFLQKNVIVAGLYEPSNAGFFVLEPVGWEQLQCIVQDRQAKHLEGNPNDTRSVYYSFDPVKGWGHAITPPDCWKSRRAQGTNWTFHFAFSDQGLLYHWTKYVRQSVSIVFEHTVENYGDDGKRDVKLIETLEEPFNYQPLIRQKLSCSKFMCDFHHFTGPTKPWLRPPPSNLSYGTRLKNATHLWFWVLQQLNERLDLGIDFDNWVTIDAPGLGLYAM
jgi:hypothetical protein